MGDAQSSLIRQQTREVRKKALINYRFLPLGAASRAAPLRRTRRRGAAARRHRGQRTQVPARPGRAGGERGCSCSGCSRLCCGGGAGADRTPHRAPLPRPTKGRPLRAQRSRTEPGRGRRRLPFVRATSGALSLPPRLLFFIYPFILISTSLSCLITPAGFFLPKGLLSFPPPFPHLALTFFRDNSLRQLPTCWRPSSASAEHAALLGYFCPFSLGSPPLPAVFFLAVVR